MEVEFDKSPLDNLGDRARTAAGWRFLSTGVNTGLQMVTGIILARLLMPKDFGILALATMVTGLAGVFRDLGLGQALVQRGELKPVHTTSAFWGTLIMGTGMCGLVMAAAPYVGAYFEEPRMVPVLRVISLTFLISPFGSVPSSLLQRELDFTRLFFAGLAGSISYGAVGISMALTGYGYWSLVAALLTSSVVGTIAICIVTRYTPPIIPTLRGITGLISFGAGATGVGITNYVAQQIDYFVIGHWLDSTALGLYRRAFTLVHQPMALIAGTLSPVLFPFFSRLLADRDRAREVMGRVLTGVSALTFSMLALFAVAAPELIPLVLGEQWQPCVFPAQIMAFAGMLRSLTNPAAMLPKGFGAVHSQMWRNGVYACTLMVASVVGTRWGIVGVAWAALLATVVIWALNAQLLYACSGFGIRDYAGALRGPALSALCVVVATVAARCYLVANEFDPWLTLAVTLAVGVIVAFLTLAHGPFPECRSFGRELRRFTVRAVGRAHSRG